MISVHGDNPEIIGKFGVEAPDDNAVLVQFLFGRQELGVHGLLVLDVEVGPGVALDVGLPGHFDAGVPRFGVHHDIFKFWPEN